MDGGRARGAVAGLLRAILRTHRSRLLPEMRALGDEYVLSEFRLHRDAARPHLLLFLRRWREYLVELRALPPNPAAVGRSLDSSSWRSLTDDQKAQLEQLKEAIGN